MLIHAIVRSSTLQPASAPASPNATDAVATSTSTGLFSISRRSPLSTPKQCSRTAASTDPSPRNALATGSIQRPSSSSAASTISRHSSPASSARSSPTTHSFSHKDPSCSASHAESCSATSPSMPSTITSRRSHIAAIALRRFRGVAIDSVSSTVSACSNGADMASGSCPLCSAVISASVGSTNAPATFSRADSKPVTATSAASPSDALASTDLTHLIASETSTACSSVHVADTHAGEFEPSAVSSASNNSSARCCSCLRCFHFND
eukprot:COSAG05_NODE_1761_length_4129_cov_6.102730_1_plen_265_part_10